MKKIHTMFTGIFKGKVAYAIVGAVVIIGSIALATSGGDGKAETAVIAKKDLVRAIAVSGKVVSMQSADLSFKASGNVARVYKDVGDEVFAGEAIVGLDQASVNANFLKAQADLAAAKADLSRLQGSSTGSAKVTSAQAETAQALADAYTTADDAVHGKADQLFTNPRSPNPQIMTVFNDYNLRIRINASRVDIESILSAWKSNQNISIETARGYLQNISSFLGDVASAVNDFDASAQLSQATIDKYKTDIASARTAVNASLAKLLSQGSSYDDVVSDVSVQAAKVAAAEAVVADYSAQLSDATIRAPFSGILSKQEAKVGETVSPNATLVSIITKGRKIEAFVPEVSIAGLAVGNVAKVTLDAYGPDVPFMATVTHIDPAETVKDGVSNYKIELAFAAADDRIRPGMTTNVSIETLRRTDTLLAPSRAILTDKDGIKTVVVMAGDKRETRQIQVGATDSSGNVEVVSGLSEGELILLDPTAN